MPEKIFVDTSGFFAFLNQDDLHHEEAKAQFGSGSRVTSNYIFDELMTLLTARGQKDFSVSFGAELRTGKDVKYHFLTLTEEEKSWQLYKKYRDHPLSFTDCTTLVLLREHRASKLLSFDEDLVRIAQNL